MNETLCRHCECELIEEIRDLLSDPTLCEECNEEWEMVKELAVLAMSGAE